MYLCGDMHSSGNRRDYDVEWDQVNEMLFVEKLEFVLDASG